jgi:hypothetical protein
MLGKDEYLKLNIIITLKGLGFNETEVNNTLDMFNDDLNHVYDILSWFSSHEFSITQLKKILNIDIVTCDVQLLELNYNNFISMGFTQQQVNDIMEKDKTLFMGVKYQNPIDDLVALGYSKEEVFRYLSLNPIAFKRNKISISERFGFIKDYGLEIILEEGVLAEFVKIPTAVIYSRYKYLSQMDMDLAVNYHLLYLSYADFYKIFRVSDTDLMITYPFNNHINYEKTRVFA